MHDNSLKKMHLKNIYIYIYMKDFQPSRERRQTGPGAPEGGDGTNGGLARGGGGVMGPQHVRMDA